MVLKGVTLMEFFWMTSMDICRVTLMELGMVLKGIKLYAMGTAGCGSTSGSRPSALTFATS